MLNYADSNSFFVSFSVYLKTILKLSKIENVKEAVGILQVLRFEFLKFRILDIFFFHFHPRNSRNMRYMQGFLVLSENIRNSRYHDLKSSNRVLLCTLFE